MRGILYISAVFGFLLSMTACLYGPTPMPFVARNKRSEDVSRRTQRVATLVSPTGRFELATRCGKDDPLYNVCTIRFPNEAVTDEYNQIDWSDDDQYAVLCNWFGGGCVRRTLAIWDMEAGREVRFLAPDELPSYSNPILAWKSAAHVLAIGFSLPGEFGAVEVDADARTITDLSGCPDWLDDGLTWGEFCQNLATQAETVQP